MPLPVDRVAYLRLRWRARVVTLVAAAPVGLVLVPAVVAAVRADDPQVNASAAWWFFQLGLYLVVASWAVGRAWRRSFAARPYTQTLDDLGAARPTPAAQGVPTLDDAAGRHLGLSGRLEPPRRW